MNKSKNIVLILSEHFTKSSWCQFEVLLADNRFVKQGPDSLVSIKLEDIAHDLMTNSLETLIKFATHAIWSEYEHSREKLWVKILDCFENQNGSNDIDIPRESYSNIPPAPVYNKTNDNSSKEETTNENSSKEQAISENSSKEQTTNDNSSKKQTTNENSSKEQTTNDNSSKEQTTNDNSSKEQTTNENSSKKQTTNENSSKEQTTNDNSSKKQTTNDNSSKEHPTNDTSSQEQTTNDNSSQEQTTNDNPSKEHDHQRSKDTIEQKDINAMFLEIFRSVHKMSETLHRHIDCLEESVKTDIENLGDKVHVI